MTAEPPPPPPDKNPFSFKNFLSRRVQGEEEDVVKVKKGPKKKAKVKTAQSDSSMPFPEVTDPKNEGDNPFSFKKFVPKQSQRATGGPGLLPAPPHEPSQKRAEGSSSDSGDDDEGRAFNPLAKKTPDTVVDRSPNFQHPNAEPLGLISRAEDSDAESSTGEGPIAPVDPLGHIPLVTAEVPPPLSLVAAGTVVGDESSDDDDDPGDGPAPPPILRHTAEPPAELLMEVSKLRAQNEELKADLEKALGDVKKEKKVNVSLKKKIKDLEKKEAEDTKALADMVQKVEENLVLSATRAATAESTIGKLKQEILSLQAQLAQANPANVQRHYEEILGGVREKTAYASKNLVVAAQNADRSIRDLMSGVEALKSVAGVLEFVDRIAVVKQT